MNKITIVMYHYVRDLKKSSHPKIKALDVSEFAGQLDYFKKYYQIVTMDDLFDAVDDGEVLPPNALLLTFDDGYKDHIEYVAPLLEKHGFQGSFFPPVETVTANKVLDVNKIHYILASHNSLNSIIARLFELVAAERIQHDLPTEAYFRRHSAEQHRYDTPDVMLVKRMLQRDLPESVRHQITHQLFTEFVDENEQAFAEQLYMRESELKQLIKNGMYVGAHGYSHRFLTHLSEAECEFEVDQSLQFLHSLGVDTTRWTMCYPFGFYNDMVISVLQKKKCTVGLSIEVGIADIRTDNIYALPRLDTNDLPKKPTMKPNAWTQQVIHSV